MELAKSAASFHKNPAAFFRKPLSVAGFSSHIRSHAGNAVGIVTTSMSPTSPAAFS
jgi:hypothetical protein